MTQQIKALLAQSRAAESASDRALWEYVHDRRPVKLTERQSLVLALLTVGDMYGLEMVEASGGKLARGVVYLTTSELQDMGFAGVIPGDRPRFTITPEGREAVADQMHGIAEVARRVRSEIERSPRFVAPPPPPAPPPGPGPAVRYDGGHPVDVFGADTFLGASYRILGLGLVGWLAYSLWAPLL